MLFILRTQKPFQPPGKPRSIWAPACCEVAMLETAACMQVVRQCSSVSQHYRSPSFTDSRAIDPSGAFSDVLRLEMPRQQGIYQLVAGAADEIVVGLLRHHHDDLLLAHLELMLAFV